jgi:fibronectin-binding autotransporter adhesin
VANGVTIGTGGGGTATLELGNAAGATLVTGTFALGSTLTLDSDANFIFSLNSTGGGAGSGASSLTALGDVSLGGTFSIDDIATSQGTLSLGDTFTVISTTANDLSGNFTNLANGGTITDGPNTFQASYNDAAGTVTLTTVAAVPEPATWGMIVAGLGMLVGIQRIRRRSDKA